MINAEGGGAAVAAAVWRVLAPRLALQCAELRQVLLPFFSSNKSCLLVFQLRFRWQRETKLCLQKVCLLDWGGPAPPAVGHAVSTPRLLGHAHKMDEPLAGHGSRGVLRWAVAVPSCWAWQCAAGAQCVSLLVQAVIALGGPADAGAELALLVAGVPRQQAGDATGFGGQPGLAAAFSEAELRQLLDWERAAALLAMHRAEAAARAEAIGAN